MIDVAQKVLEAKERLIKIYPRDVNRASDAGHPCERYLVFSRIAWDKRQPHDVRLQCIFERGKAAEQVIADELKVANFKVIEVQRPYEWKLLELRGTIDAKIELDGQRVPVEYKTVAPGDFASIAIIEDMINSKKIHVQLWPAQLLLYMFMSGSNLGLFYLKDSLTWYPKTVPVSLDENRTYLRDLIDKLTRVNEYVHKNEIPDTWPSDFSVCNRCYFFFHCGPEKHFGQEAELWDRPDTVELLERREALRSAYEEYQDLDKEVKTIFEGIQKALVGPFLIQGKEVVREIKPQPARTDRFWKLNISRMGEK